MANPSLTQPYVGEVTAGRWPDAAPRRLRAARRLSLALSVASAGAAGGTLLVPSVLHGPAAMNGSARGTALVVLAVALPALLALCALSRKRSWQVTSLWLGVTMYLAYNAVLFCFATPFNALFLPYVAMLGLSIGAGASVLVLVRASRPAEHVSGGRAVRVVRGVAVYVWVVAGLNALLWLRAIVPATGDSQDADFLRGTGLTTNPVYVEDLGFWLPLAAVSAWWLWRQRRRGVLLAGAVLTLWVVEGVSVAADQWLGSRAEPASGVVSSSMVLPFLVLAVVGCVPLALLLSRGMGRDLRP